MGFDIGVSVHQRNSIADGECDKIIGRFFRNWVGEFDHFEEQSCIIQTGKYFNLDLEPLTKRVFLDNTPDYDDIKWALQKADFLIELVDELIQRVTADNLFIDIINYETHELPNNEERAMITKLLGHDPFSRLKDIGTHPWREYVVKGWLLDDLNILKSSLTCFKSRGYEEVFLTIS